MAEDIKVIAATVKVDTGAASTNVKDLNKNLKDVNVTLKNTGKEASVTSKEIGGATGSFKNIKDQMGALPGPLGAASSGVNKLSGTFKALLANPVVFVLTAIVGVLALIYKGFTNSYEGGQKMEQVFAGIKAAGQALLDNLMKLGGIIVKIFTFDFSGAISDMQEVTDSVVNAYNAMSKLTEQAQQLKREQLVNDLDAAKRAKDLAILREQASDESIPLAKRKAALKELQSAAQENAKQDIDLAKRTAENKIAQLTLEEDGARKNAEEINKIKIDQIGVETDNANELRRINKQVTAAEKQELADRKEANAKAAELAKAERQKLVEFTNKLTKLQQDNFLLTVQDGYDKELKQLENKFADEKRANELAFKDRKITRIQQNQLDAASDIQYNLSKAAVDKKHNDELAKKEADFQKELNNITQKTRLDGIKDLRQSERVQLQIGYEEKLQDAITRYKDDQVRFTQIKDALDAQLKADQDKLTLKNKTEDDKKKYELELQSQKTIIEAKSADFEAKIAAVDAEQLLVQAAFDNKIISELEYNAKVKEMTEARMTIADLETAHKKAQVSEVAGLLINLGELVGKQTIAGKALGIATALINTYQGASEAIKQKSTLPSPFDVIAKVANVAAIIGMGLKTVKAITAVNVPGGGGAGGGGGVSAPNISPAAPVAPTQASTKIDQSSIAGIGDAAYGGVNRGGIRAYMVEQDSEAARKRAERLATASVLGG